MVKSSSVRLRSVFNSDDVRSTLARMEGKTEMLVDIKILPPLMLRLHLSLSFRLRQDSNRYLTSMQTYSTSVSTLSQTQAQDCMIHVIQWRSRWFMIMSTACVVHLNAIWGFRTQYRYTGSSFSVTQLCQNMFTLLPLQPSSHERLRASLEDFVCIESSSRRNDCFAWLHSRYLLKVPLLSMLRLNLAGATSDHTNRV